MMELGTGTPLSTAAMRAGMSENTARRYRTGPLPSQRKAPRQYRTRPDPLAVVWPEIEALLVQAPGLEATTIFETLRGRPEGPLTDGQLRTLQRRIRRWRATHGPEREVMFPQIHRPGEYAQSDFTAMGALGITLNGQPFDHLFYHFVLPYSNWETGALCVSESFEALIAGFQAAVWELGRVPALHRTDNLSAATHDLREGGRTFNERYRQVLDHYGVRPDANMPGRGHENGDVEQAHHRFKRAVEQALLLRGPARLRQPGALCAVSAGDPRRAESRAPGGASGRTSAHARAALQSPRGFPRTPGGGESLLDDSGRPQRLLRRLAADWGDGGGAGLSRTTRGAVCRRRGGDDRPAAGARAGRH
ncbi:MAG: IS21 family transposase [Nitrospira sp.]|nr:IS21 family transposase [Nitrospira sp.]